MENSYSFSTSASSPSSCFPAAYKRHKDRKEDSQLESLIIAMVNTEQFKYDFEGTRELSIYQFNESVRQVIKKTDYDNRMYGIYTGTINPKELSQKDLNWLVNYVVIITSAVRFRITKVSMNTPIIATNPCSTGCSTFATACA